MTDPNRIRRTAQQSVRRRGTSVNPQSMFGDPESVKKGTPSFAEYSSRMEATRRRTAALQGGSGDIMMASGRPRDPMFYWRQNNIPFDFTKPAELRKIREFCNTPDAPITMADGTTKPISSVQIGDQVLGWGHQMTPTGSIIRVWQDSTVTAVNTRTAPDVVQVNLASGGSIKCTPDHKWANPYFTITLTYDQTNPISFMHKVTDEYQPAAVGNELLGVQGTFKVDPSQNYYSSAPALTVADTSMDKVVSITDLGAGTVVSMETTTGNYVAWGYASKNCRLLYMTHPVIAACVDIYSKLPLQGMHIECKDEQLVEFYENLFLDQLKYEDHLVRFGRQYWLSGEAFSIGAWNENLGVWEDEQLINPDDVEVETSLFLNQPRYLMRLPETLRKILTERAPAWEFQQLMQEYPELAQYTGDDDLLPVSSYIMHQLKFEADDYSNRGVSILMRAFRTIIQEEMLMTALDSIADRLYTPMIVVKLGASASDLGTEVPWIPTEEQKLEFNASLDAALAADFRVLTTHFATNIETVFGRENVPDLSNDFDRITERILMAFGLSQTMLTGANAGETYAADALNRDVVTQLLTHYQRKLQQFFKERAEIVAEACEHFDYDVRNGERFLVTEEIYEVDEESGEGRIIEQPKLLVPELKFKILNLTDETQRAEFIESLVAAQVPIPMRNRLQTTGIDFDEMIEVKQQETVQLAVAEQETRKELYLTLLAAGLPIEDDLIKDFRPQAIPGPGMGASDVSVPTLGQGPQDLPVLAPTEDDLAEDQEAEGEQMQDDAANEETDPEAEGGDLPQEGDDVPPESNEQRGRMPKASFNIWQSMTEDEREDLRKAAFTQPEKEEDKPSGKIRTKAIRKLGIRQIALQHYKEPDNSQENSISDYQPTGRFGMPKVVGMRRYLHIPDELKAKPEE